MDGAIILGRIREEHVDFLKNKIPNLVFAGLNRINRGFDEVICDACEISTHIMEYLISLGH